MTLVSGGLKLCVLVERRSLVPEMHVIQALVHRLGAIDQCYKRLNLVGPDQAFRFNTTK